jgi:NhaP-type Na+/H+ or K+/H+ antiporter
VGVELHHNTYKALLFPFFAIFFGTLTLHLLSRYAPFVPYTVMVMLLGMAFDALLDLVYAGNLDPETYGSLKTSTDMWANIDGHVLLYAFLPALLFGDAMTLNIHSFRQCFSQCLLLACPGVFLGTGLTGLAAMYILPYDWDPFFCLCFGSILAATDPVAVVSMLKEVGASQRLTMQITGEALMNDGTAMVLFNLFWAMYNKNKGYLYNDFGSMVKFFCRMSIAGPILGYFLGYISYRWMALATRRHVETDIIVQTSITLFTAYLSFFLGESECFVSGVLCCVTSACVLADKCWPVVNDHHSLENVWHAIEYFGNSVLFFLAGVITHRSITSHEDGGISAEVDFTASDYGYVLLFYMVMTGIRSLMILLFYPLLTRMGGGTNPKDAAFVVWAGLRGAVGLALAQLVLQSGGDQRAGKQLLFVVAGLALLTLIVQGTTCGPLLAKWGMLGIPTVKEAMLEKVFVHLCIQRLILS